MKNWFIFLSIAILFLISCQKENLPAKFNIGQEEEFTWGYKYLSTDNNLKLTITEINDSRCPSDVVCIWQGEAIIKLQIEINNNYNIELSTFDNLTDTLENYSITLVDVLPYPVSTETIEMKDYVVSLRIKEFSD